MIKGLSRKPKKLIRFSSLKGSVYCKLKRFINLNHRILNYILHSLWRLEPTNRQFILLMIAWEKKYIGELVQHGYSKRDAKRVYAARFHNYRIDPIISARHAITKILEQTMMDKVALFDIGAEREVPDLIYERKFKCPDCGGDDSRQLYTLLGCNTRHRWIIVCKTCSLRIPHQAMYQCYRCRAVYGTKTAGRMFCEIDVITSHARWW